MLTLVDANISRDAGFSQSGDYSQAEIATMQRADIRGYGFEALLVPDDYTAPQAFGEALRAEGANGVVYPSVRHAGGEFIGVFHPDAVTPPVQGDHFRYFWDSAAIRYVRKISRGRAILDLVAELGGFRFYVV